MASRTLGPLHRDANNWRKLVSFVAEYTDKAEIYLQADSRLTLRFVRIDGDVIAIPIKASGYKL
jgi:hypothetical protein